jgi:hypothetical protein
MLLLVVFKEMRFRLMRDSYVVEFFGPWTTIKKLETPRLSEEVDVPTCAPEK